MPRWGVAFHTCGEKMEKGGSHTRETNQGSEPFRYISSASTMQCTKCGIRGAKILNNSPTGRTSGSWGQVLPLWDCLGKPDSMWGCVGKVQRRWGCVGNAFLGVGLCGHSLQGVGLCEQGL